MAVALLQQSDLGDSPLYLLAVLVSARRSRDRALERVTHRRLKSLGVRITFGDGVPTPAAKRPQGGGHA